MSTAGFDQAIAPTFFACGGAKIDQLLSKWLSKPDLDEAILISYAFNPEYKSKDASLGRQLERLAESTHVTLVTTIKTGVGNDATGPQSAYRRLATAGVRVLSHDTLHAKTFLFRRGTQVFWVVGSSNLTKGGLASNEEVNVAGYRLSDYQTVHSQVVEIIDYAQPLRYSISNDS